VYQIAVKITIMSKLVIIDGNAILHRAFHAIPPLTTPKQEPINAVYGLVSMLLNIIQNLKPDAIVVAFDEKAPTFRQKELPTYQAQRPPMASELSSQFQKARDFLSAAKIPVYSKPGYEADDVIGTIASQSKSKYKIDETIIVTGDRDQLQLVDDKLNIKLYMPIAGLINAKLYDEAATKERMGVPPTQIVDLKSLTGDPSDNYFGVSGIGPKTAINLLQCYVTLKQIYKHLDEISDRVREKLEKGKKSADQSYFLATIVRDVPIDINFEEMENWKLDSLEVLKLFEEFGFKTLSKRILDVGRKIEEDKQGALF
jgi:DNA polymerase-1